MRYRKDNYPREATSRRGSMSPLTDPIHDERFRGADCFVHTHTIMATRPSRRRTYKSETRIRVTTAFPSQSCFWRSTLQEGRRGTSMTNSPKEHRIYARKPRHDGGIGALDDCGKRRAWLINATATLVVSIFPKSDRSSE